MSTHAMIYKENPDHTYTGVYLHFDGYPEWAGDHLVNHYNTDERVKALIELGDLSTIGKDLIDPVIEEYGFDYYSNEECRAKYGEDFLNSLHPTLAYHRDRGEPFSQDHIDKLENHIDVSFTYVWTLNHQWKMLDSKNQLIDIPTEEE